MNRRSNKQRVPVIGGLALLLMTSFSLLATPPGRGRIDPIGAEITYFRFFESGQDLVPVDEREYKTRFPKETTRFIAWELNLEYPEKERDLIFDIVGIYYLNGQRYLTRTWNKKIQRGWTDSWHVQSIGTATPGAFEPGNYRLEMFVDEKWVVTGWFEVFSVSEAKGPPLEGDDFPDDLGEL